MFAIVQNIRCLYTMRCPTRIMAYNDIASEYLILYATSSASVANSIRFAAPRPHFYVRQKQKIDTINYGSFTYSKWHLNQFLSASQCYANRKTNFGHFLNGANRKKMIAIISIYGL